MPLEKKPKKILVICPHPEDTAPGQRLKYEQYFESWRDAGYELTISPFMTNRFWKVVYQKGHLLEKIFWIFVGIPHSDKRFNSIAILRCRICLFMGHTIWTSLFRAIVSESKF